MYSFQKFFNRAQRSEKWCNNPKLGMAIYFSDSETPPSLTIHPWKTYQLSFRNNAKRTLRIYLNCYIASRFHPEWRTQSVLETTGELWSPPSRRSTFIPGTVWSRNPWWHDRSGPQSLPPVVTWGPWLLSLLFPLNSYSPPMRTVFLHYIKCIAM